MDEELRTSLLRLIRYKFATYPNVAILADDIVQEAYLRLRSGKTYFPDKENYGCLSVVCIRLAYRKFMEQAASFSNVYMDEEGTLLLAESDVVDELIQAEDASAVLESLKILRDIERIVITQRYYGYFSFAEIAERNKTYAVAADVLCIICCPIGKAVDTPTNMPFAKYVRECWESENDEPFYFMDWIKMLQAK